MNIDQIVYVSGENSLRKFILKFALPLILAISAGLMVSSYMMSYLGILPADLFPLAVIVSPLVGIIATGIVLYVNLKNKQSDIDNNLPLFVTFLGTIATKGQRYSSFFKIVAENDSFGEISKEMKKVYNLAVYWKLGYAEACRVVATISPSDLFSRFISRLSNTIEYGEDLGSYLISEQETLMKDIEINFQESIYFISTITELFSALISSFSFLTIFVVLMPIFIKIKLDLVLYGMVVALIVFDIFFVFLAKSLLPRDKLTHSLKMKSTEQVALSLLLPISLIAVFALGIIVFRFSPFSLSVNLALTFSPLLIIGYLARQQENTIRIREFSFMSFIRSLGEKAQMHRGSFEPIIYQMRGYHYDRLNHLIDSLHMRLSVVANIFVAWNLFLMECGSNLVNKFGGMFLQAIYLGSDPKQVGDVIADNLNRLLQVRKLRDKTAAGSVGEVYGAFAGIALSMYITGGLALFLYSVFTGVHLEKSEAVPGIAFLDFSGLQVGPIQYFMTVMAAIHAAFSAVFIKMLDGGLLIGAFIHFSIMLWIMVAIEFGVNSIFATLVYTPV